MSYTDIGLAQAAVNAIGYDSEKGIWVGTAAGVSRFYNNKWLPLTTKDGLVNNQVTRIVGDNSNNVWIGTLDGLSCYHLH